MSCTEKQGLYSYTHFSVSDQTNSLLSSLKGHSLCKGRNVHQSLSQNASGDLTGVAGGDGKLGCLCGRAGTSHVCDGSVHSSGCVVNGYGCLLSYYGDGSGLSANYKLLFVTATIYLL